MVVNRRDFLKATAAGALGLAGLAAQAEGASKRRPNIVFIFIDDMGYADPSCFGNPKVRTPQIDRLAADQGVPSRAVPR